MLNPNAKEKGKSVKPKPKVCDNPLMKCVFAVRREGAGIQMRQYLAEPNFEARLEFAIEKARSNVLPPINEAKIRFAVKMMRELRRIYVEENISIENASFFKKWQVLIKFSCLSNKDNFKLTL